jgi:DNA-binding transcriptional MerR regulator
VASTFTIGDLAAEFGVTTRTIRFYEDKGLLTPRRHGTHRVFGPRDRTRLRLILRGKRIGFSLAEIAEIVGMYDDAPGERGQLELLIARAAEHRATLELKRAAIDSTLDELAEVENRAAARLAEL